MNNAAASPTAVAIIGAAGRMGRSLLEHAHNLPELTVTAAIVAPQTNDIGAELGPQRIVAQTELTGVIANCDVIIDFSAPESCLQAARIAAHHQKPIVSGTTGLAEKHWDELRELATQTAILHANNFSVGVNLLEGLVEMASRATGATFDLEVFEAHHRHKVDAPGGTARMLGAAAARGRGLELEDVATWTRSGHTGPRTDSEIGFQVVRGGDIVGEHTVFLCGAGERIELTHRATNRGIFALGALRAAAWISGREPGWYTMKDVLF